MSPELDDYEFDTSEWPAIHPAISQEELERHLAAMHKPWPPPMDPYEHPEEEE